MKIALHRIAHGRTGDKGDRSNISVIAWEPAFWPHLVDQVTEDAVARQFADRCPSRVTRHLLPKLQAMNFVLDNVLDGGVNDSLNLDSHGKSLSYLLLDIEIDVPDDLAGHLVGTDPAPLPHTTPEETPLNRPIPSPTARRAGLLALAVAATLPFSSPVARAQDYPSKTITFIVPFAAGSATDQLARALGQSITEQTGQPVIADNKPGASGMVAAQIASRAPADGHTVLITTNTTQAANQHLYKKLPYDPVKDFAPVTGLGKGGQVLVVNAAAPYNTVADLIAAAKKAPGKLTFGSGSSSSRVAGEMLKQLAGVDITHVPYKSNPLGITDLLGSQIDLMITDVSTGIPQVKAGKLTALGYSTQKRSTMLPEVPTIAEAGVPGYDMGYWFAAYVPAKTSPAVVSRLNALLTKAVQSQTARAFFDNSGSEPWTSTPEELADFQATETGKWGKVIKAAGIEPE